MSRYQPTSQNFDSGTTKARTVRRCFRPRALGNAVAAPVIRRVQKTYGSRLPVSGQESPRIDARERRNLDTARMSDHPSGRELHREHASERARIRELERLKDRVRREERERERRALAGMLPEPQRFDDSGFCADGWI